MKLLVTRPALDAGPLSDLLTAAGHTVLLDPLLSIRFRDRGALDLDGATGLLFTSGNGVRAFAALSQRRDIPAYAVGDRTATLARELGFGQIDSADGDVAALVALVRAQRKPEDGLLLHVSGHDVAGELAQSLEAAGYGVRRAVLYDAEPAADLAPATRTALDTGTLDGVLLFSPRTARHFVALMHQSGLASHASRIEAWCLSPAVAQALDGLNLARIHTAAEPTQAALLSLVPPAPKEDVLTEAPPPKTPPTGKGPAIKKARVEPTIAAAISAGRARERAQGRADRHRDAADRRDGGRGRDRCREAAGREAAPVADRLDRPGRRGSDRRRRAGTDDQDQAGGCRLPGRRLLATPRSRNGEPARRPDAARRRRCRTRGIERPPTHNAGARTGGRHSASTGDPRGSAGTGCLCTPGRACAGHGERQPALVRTGPGRPHRPARRGRGPARSAAGECGPHRRRQRPAAGRDRAGPAPGQPGSEALGRSGQRAGGRGRSAARHGQPD